MEDRGSPISEYDQFVDFYYDFIQAALAAPDSFFRQNISVMMRMLGDVRGLQVCDLACGEGFLARILAAEGADVTGVDLSEALLDHAERQSEGLTIHYIRDDAQRLDRLDEASFDAVVCHMALMDIPDLDATIRAVDRVLNKGGCSFSACFTPALRRPTILTIRPTK